MTEEIRITAEPKDNNTCRFVVDRPIYPDGSAFFGSRERAIGSGLAEKLFAIDGVSAVLIQDNVVTVTAATGGNWMPVAKQVGATIRAVVGSGEKAVSDAVLSSIPDADVIKKRVQSILDQEINPAVAAHGGWVELIDVKRNEVFIRMGGGCVGLRNGGRHPQAGSGKDDPRGDSRGRRHHGHHRPRVGP